MDVRRVQKLDPAVRRCKRSRRHDFDEDHPYAKYRAKGAAGERLTQIVLRCDRCETLRLATYYQGTWIMYTSQYQYKWPDGYLDSENGEDPIPVEAYRAAAWEDLRYEQGELNFAELR